MSIEKVSKSAREYFETGVAAGSWNKPFDLDVTASSPAASAPDSKTDREAAALRRHIAGELREAWEHHAELGVSARPSVSA